MSNTKILVIADTQVRQDVDFSYLTSIGRYIVDKRPDYVVHIGDHYDFPSLSSYDKGKKSFEGRRLLSDIEAGNKGMELLLKPLQELQARQRANKKKVYSPVLYFCNGNHESRMDRLVEEMPELDGLLGTATLNIEKHGWTVYPFLKPVEICGIFFVHYLANPMTGKPYGGTALSQLKMVGKSFVVGHKQCLDIAVRPTLDGKQQIGIINGAAYLHDESYKGEQGGNRHFRGVTLLTEVADGFGIPCIVSTQYLVNKYGV